MKTGTRLAVNSKYGMPRNGKIQARLKAWKVWAQGISLLRQIHIEIADKLAAKDCANDMLQHCTDQNTGRAKL